METENEFTPEAIPSPRSSTSFVGVWAVEPEWLSQFTANVNNGLIPKVEAAAGNGGDLFSVTRDGIAVIPMSGPMVKGFSFFGGVSTLQTRRAVREAAGRKDVKGILLHIDSPGGMVAGTADLASDVRMAGTIKPVHAHIDDLGASAAFWVASQATHISANPTAQVGSIGTMAVVADSSEAAKKVGIKVIPVTTGKLKGAFTPGTAITKEQVAHLQTRVDDLQTHFSAAVSEGRGLSGGTLERVSTGETFIAAKAMSLGLIDSVGSIDTAIMGTLDPAGIAAVELPAVMAGDTEVDENPVETKPEGPVKTPNADLVDKLLKDRGK